MSDLERHNLEAHVDLCAERYQALYNKLDHVDSRITQLEEVIQGLSRQLNDFREKTVNRYLTWAGVIIGSLCAIVGALASRLF